MEFLDLTVEQLASGYVETEFTYECIYCDFKTFKTEIYNYNDVVLRQEKGLIK